MRRWDQSDRTALFVVITMAAMPVGIVGSLIDKTLGIALFLICLAPWALMLLATICMIIANIEPLPFIAGLWFLFLLMTISYGWQAGMAGVALALAAQQFGKFAEKWKL
jgi:hypothetical protein